MLLRSASTRIDKLGQMAQMDDGEKIFAMLFACFLVVPPPAWTSRVKRQETDDSDEIIAIILSVS